ncbi:MAG TPA: hypothetical protein VEB43_09910 [Anaeromyxobacter sp.]|nr:hypothetical protein [Anaeromyxobacter sp.]
MARRERKTFYERIVTVFGDILVYPWPLFLLYNPKGYRVRGEDIRELLEVIRPGDVLVRGYDNYLDGRIIPGYFSHVGLYVGDITEADAATIAAAGAREGLPEAHRVKPGRSMVVHALAEGVLTEDVINFCRCDYMAVLRAPARLAARNTGWTPVVAEESLDPRERAILARLRAGEPVDFAEALPLVREAALGRLGTRYDFKFDFARLDRLSCSELVYFAMKALGPFLDVGPVNRRMLLFFKRSVIEPDAFVRSPLDLVWKSRSVSEARLAALRPDHGGPISVPKAVVA